MAASSRQAPSIRAPGARLRWAQRGWRRLVRRTAISASPSAKSPMTQARPTRCAVSRWPAPCRASGQWRGCFPLQSCCCCWQSRWRAICCALRCQTIPRAKPPAKWCWTRHGRAGNCRSNTAASMIIAKAATSPRLKACRMKPAFPATRTPAITPPCRAWPRACRRCHPAMRCNGGSRKASARKGRWAAYRAMPNTKARCGKSPRARPFAPIATIRSIRG